MRVAARTLCSVAVMMGFGIGCLLGPAGDQVRIERGLEIAPTPLRLEGKDRALVGLGSYIVNAQAGCFECHTNPPYLPGGNPYLGQPIRINAANYLAGGVEFTPSPYFNPFPLTSRNITPDEHGNPAGMDYPTFLNALRTGMRYRATDAQTDFATSSRVIAARPERYHFGPGDPLEAMPWPVFRMMTDYDIRAVYEYLRAIPHAEPGRSP